MRLYPEAPAVRVLGERTYQTKRIHRYGWTLEGRDFRLTLPEGFIFDGASFPAPARVVYDTWSLGVWPVLIHDYAYRYGGRVPRRSYQEIVGAKWHHVPGGMDRYTADWLMLDLMRDKGVGRLRRNLAFHAIRAGGWRSWRRGLRGEKDHA